MMPPTDDDTPTAADDHPILMAAFEGVLLAVTLFGIVLLAVGFGAGS